MYLMSLEAEGWSARKEPWGCLGPGMWPWVGHQNSWASILLSTRCRITLLDFIFFFQLGGNVFKYRKLSKIVLVSGESYPYKSFMAFCFSAKLFSQHIHGSAGCQTEREVLSQPSWQSPSFLLSGRPLSISPTACLSSPFSYSMLREVPPIYQVSSSVSNS